MKALKQVQTNAEIFYYLDFKKIEKLYDAVFVGVFSKTGDVPLPVFYVDFPDRSKGHVNYIAFQRYAGSYYIQNADWVETLNIKGLLLPSGEIIYSSYRHHYNEKDGLFIDGGPCYSRSNSTNLVDVVVRGGSFYLVSN